MKLQLCLAYHNQQITNFKLQEIVVLCTCIYYFCTHRHTMALHSTHTTVVTIIDIYSIHSPNENPSFNGSIVELYSFSVNVYYLSYIGYLNYILGKKSFEPPKPSFVYAPGVIHQACSPPFFPIIMNLIKL